MVNLLYVIQIAFNAQYFFIVVVHQETTIGLYVVFNSQCVSNSQRGSYTVSFFRFTIFRIYLCYRINLALLTTVLCREDILVFLTGQEEIEATVRNIREISKELQTGRCYYQNV